MTATEVDRRERALDLSFLAGVGLKVLNALSDLAIGIPLLFLDPHRLSYWAQLVTDDVLAQDPDNPLANYLLDATAHLTTASLSYAAFYLLVHAVVKVAIIVALVRGSLRVYPWALLALLALLVYQFVDFAFSHSIMMLVLSILDGIVLWLTWREWRHHRVLQTVLLKYAPRFASRWPFPAVRPERGRPGAWQGQGETDS